MLNKFLTNLKEIENDCHKDQYNELVCKAVANFCLNNSIKASQFQSEFLKQMVCEAKKNNPHFSKVRLSAYTGIDRRRINRVLNGEKLYHHSPREDIVLNYIYSYCNKNHTHKIVKHGGFESFQYFCSIAANGTLTHRAIASELIAQKKLKDCGSYYLLIRS